MISMSPPAIVLFAAVILLRAVTGQSQTALQRLENIDVDKILGNNRILTNYVRCFLDEGACSPEARDFKSKYGIINNIQIKIVITK